MDSRDSLTSLMSLDSMVLLVFALPSPWRDTLATLLLSLFGLGYLSQVMVTFLRPLGKHDANMQDAHPRAKRQKSRRQRHPHVRH